MSDDAPNRPICTHEHTSWRRGEKSLGDQRTPMVKVCNDCGAEVRDDE